MRIRNLLLLSSGASLAMVLVVAVSLAYSSSATRLANVELAGAASMRATLLEHVILRDEYINRREDRARNQLEAKARSLESQIVAARAAYPEAEDESILEEMTREAAAMTDTNKRFVANLRNSTATGPARVQAAEYNRMLLGQLLIKTYMLNDYASRLIDRRLARISSIKRASDWLQSASLCLVAGLVLVNGLLIGRILSRGLRRLLDGASNIGGGDLGYRLTVDSNDEIAEVAGKINGMAEALQGSFVSIAGLEERVALRTAELDESNRELEAFAYSVAHDLRAPLRSMDGFSHILEEELGPGLSPEAGRLLGIIRENARKMDSLISSLLELSRLGKTSLSLSRLDMRALAGSAFSFVAVPGSDFRFELGEMPDAAADQSMIERVWSNLLSNAVKYSLPSPTHWIEVGGDPRDGMNVYFVRDRGVGFDPRFSDKLFGMFQRLHDQRDFPGNGVGLAIVQRIVSRHGGKVWAEGSPGQGAVFYFSLPARSHDGRQEAG